MSSVSEKCALPDGVYVPLFTAPSGCADVVVNYRIVSNDITTDTTVRAAICNSGYVAGTAPSPADWIQPGNFKIGPSGVTVGIMEDTSVVMGPGEVLVVWASNGTSSAFIATARVHGFQKATS